MATRRLRSIACRRSASLSHMTISICLRTVHSTKRNSCVIPGAQILLRLKGRYGGIPHRRGDLTPLFDDHVPCCEYSGNSRLHVRIHPDVSILQIKFSFKWPGIGALPDEAENSVRFLDILRSSGCIPQQHPVPCRPARQLQKPAPWIRKR